VSQFIVFSIVHQFVYAELFTSTAATAAERARTTAQTSLPGITQPDKQRRQSLKLITVNIMLSCGGKFRETVNFRKMARTRSPVLVVA